MHFWYFLFSVCSSLSQSDEVCPILTVISIVSDHHFLLIHPVLNSQSVIPSARFTGVWYFQCVAFSCHSSYYYIALSSASLSGCDIFMCLLFAISVNLGEIALSMSYVLSLSLSFIFETFATLSGCYHSLIVCYSQPRTFAVRDELVTFQGICYFQFSHFYSVCPSRCFIFSTCYHQVTFNIET